MPKQTDWETHRKSLDQICTTPDAIISVYALEKHIWADGNSPEAKRGRRPELKTVEEFEFGPVRPFLMDILRNMAAPYSTERGAHPVGQGYWIQAEFGSGKSHVMCCLGALALGDERAWEIVARKEKAAGRGRRDSLAYFWDEGIRAKSTDESKGIFVIMKTLVGSGSGVVGGDEKGGKLSEYVLDAAKEQIEAETGKNLSLYPAELLADRFVREDLERYRKDLRAFFADRNYFEPGEAPESVDEFIESIQSNRSPDYKRDCGDKLWRFYTEYLKVKPNIEAETEDILKHMVATILAEGYSGVLLLLDEVSLFMKDRDEDQRADDEKTLVVLSNRLAKIHNLPIWTVCSAQQQIESKLGAKNIIADDRLKMVELLRNESDYYDIALARVRTITDEAAILPYFLHYRRGFTWPNSIGEQEFTRFFPFHRPALEVIRAITYELTTTRSAIHFMHQTLREQMKARGRELIRLWEMFDEAMAYDEDPSGVRAAISAVRTKRDTEYRAYEKCRTQIDGVTKGYLKVYRDKAIRTLQTLFLYYLARLRTEGLEPEEIANAVLIERDDDSNPDENAQHYETIADNLRGLLPQVGSNHDEDGRARFFFEPVLSGGVIPAEEFQRARDAVEANEQLQAEAWQHLLALDEWTTKARQVTIELTGSNKSIFRDVSRYVGIWENATTAKHGDQVITVRWNGRDVSGVVSMQDLQETASRGRPLPAISTPETDHDYAVIISEKPVSEATIDTLLKRAGDPRVIFWVPDALTAEEKGRLLDFGAYEKMIKDWEGKDSEEALAVVKWVSDEMKKNLAGIKRAVDQSYGRGRLDAAGHRKMETSVSGELPAVITEAVSRVLSATYESRHISFDVPSPFRNEEGVKVINGIVRRGEVPRTGVAVKDISAVQNYGVGLGIVKRSAERKLDVSDNPYVTDLMGFIEDKLLGDGESMPIETVYKNFTGIGGPKDYGLSRRMVQIYLLCLVQNGRLRIQVGPKSGLAGPAIDYSNIAEIDFSARVLDSLVSVQRMAQPEDWGTLRPYAEKLLGRNIAATADDAAIQQARSDLRHLFADEAPKARATAADAAALFEDLRVPNPYATEVEQVRRLFEAELEGGDDIGRLLHALKEAMGYEAYDDDRASQSEVDDLANRLRNYRDVQGFLEIAGSLRAARAYCDHQMPEGNTLKSVRRLQRAVADKLANLQPYIDDELKRRTELVGKIPPQAGETDTIGALVHEYSAPYFAAHDQAVHTAIQVTESIDALLSGPAMSALRALEGITALQPPASHELARALGALRQKLFHCPNPARTHVERSLGRAPVHDCGLRIEDVHSHIEACETIGAEARRQFDATVRRKMGVFLNEAVQGRLRQGAQDPGIAALLACTTADEVRDHLLEAAAQNPDIVSTINRYLKQIRVKKVRLADFRPTRNTVETSQIDQVTEEFREFLRKQINEMDGNSDDLPMLQLD